jgi:hypothetical protein
MRMPLVAAGVSLCGFFYTLIFQAPGVLKSLLAG